MKCGQIKNIDKFRRLIRNNTEYFARSCSDCSNAQAKKYDKDHRYVRIYRVCRKFNDKFGVKCDFDRKYVKGLTKLPCTYCGIQAKIGLDRIDSNGPYLKYNIVPCCIRCNFIKKDMPIGAWNILYPEIKRIKDAGLFGNWCPRGFEL